MVRCGFPKPLSVDLLTISLLVGSPRRCKVRSGVQTSASFPAAPTDLFPSPYSFSVFFFFKITHGRRQATETESHGRAAITKSFLVGVCWGCSGGRAMSVCLSLLLVSSLDHWCSTGAAGGQCKMFASAHAARKNPENTPFTPSTLSDQPAFERGNRSTHTRPSCLSSGLTH